MREFVHSYRPETIQHGRTGGLRPQVVRVRRAAHPHRPWRAAHRRLREGFWFLCGVAVGVVLLAAVVLP